MTITFWILHHCTFKTPTFRWAFFIRALVTVTLQPINYRLYIDNSAKGGIIKYNLHFKGAKVYYVRYLVGVILGVPFFHMVFANVGVCPFTSDDLYFPA